MVMGMVVVVAVAGVCAHVADGAAVAVPAPCLGEKAQAWPVELLGLGLAPC